MRTKLNKLLGILLVTIGLFACTDSATNDSVKEDSLSSAVMTARYVLDTHYKAVNQVVDNETDMIIVAEFFWYGCPHCEKFEAPLAKWEAGIADDVVLKRSPAVWNDAMVLHAKLFFIANALDRQGDIHERLFKETIAIRAEKDLNVQQAHFAKVFSEYGLPEAEFEKQLVSFKVKGQAENAIKLMRASGLTGTPSIVVNGKYLVITDAVSTASGIMDIADHLIDQERTLRRKP